MRNKCGAARFGNICLVLISLTLLGHAASAGAMQPTADASKKAPTPAERKASSDRAATTEDSELGAPINVLTTDEWANVDAAVRRALEWLAAQQSQDGAFPTSPLGQPGITSLCT